MVNKLLHIITKRLSLNIMRGVNVVGTSSELGDTLFLVYCQKEIYVCNQSFGNYMDYLGFPYDVYFKHRKDIIRHIISESSVINDNDVIIMLMRDNLYTLDKENIIEEFSYI